MNKKSRIFILAVSRKVFHCKTYFKHYLGELSVSTAFKSNKYKLNLKSVTGSINKLPKIVQYILEEYQRKHAELKIAMFYQNTIHNTQCISI